MIHNKHLWILKPFTEDYAREIYGRGLVGKVPLSQKAIALALDELESDGVLKYRLQGNIKYFKLNITDTKIKDVILSVEIAKKLKFFKKQRKLAHIFKSDTRVVGIFGSYANGTETKASDIDLFIVGRKKGQDYSAEGKKLDLNISIKYFSEQEFAGLIKKKNLLCKEIIRNHLIIFGAENFVNTLWRDYYGLN